jgi:hypothetical protein
VRRLIALTLSLVGGVSARADDYQWMRDAIAADLKGEAEVACQVSSQTYSPVSNYFGQWRQYADQVQAWTPKSKSEQGKKEQILADVRSKFQNNSDAAFKYGNDLRDEGIRRIPADASELDRKYQVTIAELFGRIFRFVHTTAAQVGWDNADAPPERYTRLLYDACVAETSRHTTNRIDSAVSMIPRDGAAIQEQPVPVDSEGPDDVTCSRYGFHPVTDGYAQCRMTLDAARRDFEQRQTLFAAEQKQYQERVAAAEREQARQRSLKRAELGFRMAAAASQPGATFLGALSQGAAETAGIWVPEPPRPPSGTTVYQINGSTIVCNQTGNIVNCQ